MVNISKYNLDEICVSKQKPRTLRRINGLQLPLHPQQIVGWIAILITTVISYTIVIPAQCKWFQDIVWPTFLMLHLLHVVSHATALLLDPAEKQLRQLSRSAVAEFDRNIHAHVIENGRCHLCNIQTSNKETKHCSICNKCISGFDHHCKWLNHCIGKRNYLPFFLSVSTATILSLLTAIICILDIIFYFVSPQLLNRHRKFLVNEPNATMFEPDPTDWTFVSVLSVFGFTNSVIGCVLMHLCAFHIYIRILGVSTYEYIVRNIDPEHPDDGNHSKDRRNICVSLFQGISNSKCNKREPQSCGKKYRFHNNRVGNTVNAISNNYVGKVESRDPLQSNEARDIIHISTINNNGNNVTNLMAIIMDKVNSRNQLFYKQQKQVHPSECVLE